MGKFLAEMSKAKSDEFMAFKKSAEQFKGNDVYTMKATPAAAPGAPEVPTPEFNFSICPTDKGLLYASDAKGLEKLYGMKLKPLGKKGIMMLRMDLSKMAMPGVPPVQNVIEMLMSSEGNKAKMTVSF